MTRTIHAIYENGVFRPMESVDLPDHCEVEVEVRLADSVRAQPLAAEKLPPPAGDAAANRVAVTGCETPVADFLEPLQYAWTDASYEARQALKQYSEATHADY